MVVFLKYLVTFIGALLFLSIVLVAFIIVVMGFAAIYEEFTEKKQINYNSVQPIYTDGRKTIESFGTRKEFAILRFSIDKDKQTALKKSRWSLYDRDNSKSIDSDVKYYKKTNKYVYAIGEKGYTKLNYETAEIIQNKDINIFSNEDIKIFKELEVGKGFIKH